MKKNPYNLNFNKKNILYFILFIILIFFILYFIKNNFNYEHYKGLSRVNEFQELLEKKYDVDKENKIITYCKEDDVTNKKVCKSVKYSYHFNEPSKKKLVDDKISTSTILKNNNLPVPSFFKLTFSNNIQTDLNNLKKNMKENNINYPIVLKQIYGTFGIDVYTHIENDKNALEILQKLKQKYKSIMCEEQIAGDCYRIFVFNGKIIDVIKREAPYVIGDGKHTIKELIEIRNENQLKKGLFITKNISYTYMEKLGYDVNNVLPKNKKLIISTVINMHNGADISRVPISSIPKENLDIFIKANKVIDIVTSGIDFLSTDITKPYNGKILELNGTPDTEIHNIVSKQSNDPFNIYEKVANHVSSMFD